MISAINRPAPWAPTKILAEDYVFMPAIWDVASIQALNRHYDWSHAIQYDACVSISVKALVDRCERNTRY